MTLDRDSPGPGLPRIQTGGTTTAGMAWDVRLDHDSYVSAREEFSWGLPDDYNIAYDCLRKHDRTDRPALYQHDPGGDHETYTFDDLDDQSNQLAHALAELGVDRGDRVGVVVPQNPLTHFACWKLGAVSLPLSVLFGVDALQHRLDDSGATVVVADESVLGTVQAAAADCPDLEYVVAVDADDPEDAHDFAALRQGYPRSMSLAETNPETPAIIMYTSGSTGPPKGVLHGHGVWVGHCPAFYMYFERAVDESVFWTPADWAWIGALGDLVFPAWHYGRPVVGYPMEGFDTEQAFGIAEEHGVTDTFLPPTAIRMMMTVEDPTQQYDLDLKAVCSGGEPLTPEILGWADDTLDGVAVNELYGQTEANLLVTNCRKWFSAQAGSMGKPVPGHDVAVVDPETGERRADGEVGMLAVRRDTGDPAVFKQYWNRPERTAAVTVTDPEGVDWHLTEDLGYRDEDGYLWFKARDDDVIITSGYRVGPGEVESAILEHDDVEQAGVAGVPDETRNEIIKAFIQPVAGVEGDDELRQEVRDLVRDSLAEYEYPREVDFVEELPTTTTGKIQRRKLREEEG